MLDLLAVGNEIKDGYGTSISDGHAAWQAYARDGMRVYHVPELPGDGTPVDLSKLLAAGRGGTEALSKLGTRITVEAVRQAGENTLILESVFTGTLPDGAPFRYPNVIIFSFRDGSIEQLVEVASAEMWSTLQQAMRATGYQRPPSAP